MTPKQKKRLSASMKKSWTKRRKAADALPPSPFLLENGTKAVPKGDPINHPTHYTNNMYETINVIEDMVPDYKPVHAVLVSNVIQYLARAPYKGKYVDDLLKAQWYLNRLVTRAEAE